ncbi:telomerase-binding protein EST1A-like [Macrobrachium nipponense]|uniref:telomerase-binding protein EST1A-like n=1 Tax=Macrobrachium nipponense TaxID=159736 RepID=UPI0030C87318
MSASKGDDCDDSSAVDDASSSKGRVRKSKKPEIQIYQPRPLREKLRSQSSEPSKSPQEVTSPKPQAARETKGETREQEIKKVVKPKSPEVPAQQDASNQYQDGKDKYRGNRDAAKRGIRKKREMAVDQGNNPDEIIDKGQNKSSESATPGVAEVSNAKIQGHQRNSEGMHETKLQHKSSNKGGNQLSTSTEEPKGQCSLTDKEKLDEVKSHRDNYSNSKFKDEEKGFTDCRNSEKKMFPNKDRHYEKPQRKRKGRNSSYQEEDSFHSSSNDTYEVKSAEFYPSSMGKKDTEAFKSKNNTNSFKQRFESRAAEDKMPDKVRNERGYRRHDESLHEEQSGRTSKNSQQYRGKKPQIFKGEYHGYEDDIKPDNYETKSKDLDIAELASKVEKVSLERSYGKEASSKKGVPKLETKDKYSGDSVASSMKCGRWKNEEGSDGYCDSPDKSSTLVKSAPGASPQKPVDKGNKAKSYSVARESRKNRSANKSVQNNEKQNIEVTVSRDGQGRTTQVKKDKLSRKDAENQRPPRKIKDHEDRNWDKDEIYSSSDRFHSHTNVKGKWQSRSTCDSESQDKGLIYIKDTCDEKDTVEPMNFINIPDEDWNVEVDREMAWCNAREQGITGKPPTWEDEELPWKHEKGERRHEKQSAYTRRADSPGHRGGLIQLPTTFATPECISRGQTFSEHAEPAPVMQKHLYNPNNPSKPVLVVPSARDLPLSRDTQRESNKNFEDNGVNSFSFQGHSSGGHIPDNHSPKVDPTILYNIQKGELDISYYVSSNQLPIEFRRIMDIRHHLQSCYKQLLMSDIRMCQEKNIEGALWKTLYYIIIEKLREYITREPNLKDRSLATLRMLVDEGQQYLHGLLDALQREYNFTLEDHLEEEGISNSGVRTRAIRMPLMSAQKLLLSLGDLARYKEHYSPNPNYALAKKWYHMALQVYPRNGRPFNQLAIIAANQKRPLDVVYYYIRFFDGF